MDWTRHLCETEGGWPLVADRRQPESILYDDRDDQALEQVNQKLYQQQS